MSTEPISLIRSALIKAVGVINTLPPERQERSNRDDMILLFRAFADGNYPGEKGTVTGRDNYIVTQALAYAIAVEHPNKEEMKQLLEELSGGFAWAEFLMAGADRHIHG
jgi:hypothetical protein